MRPISVLLILIFCGAALLAPRAQAQEAPPADLGKVPVVIAVDTSRSLQKADLEKATSRLRALIESLPADTPTGLLAFDDDATWIVPAGSSPQAVVAGLAQLRAQGRFTRLHDALIIAARDLENGGVILLATDGRDEDSATTVEDLARRCEAQNIKILSTGTGRISETLLKRLALLSAGTYLGPAATLDGPATQALGQARQVVATKAAETARKTAAPAPQPVIVEREIPAPVPTPAPSSNFLPLLLSALAALGGLGSIIALLWSRRRQERSPVDEETQRKLEELAADEAEAAGMRLELAQVEAMPPRESSEVTVDTAVVFQRGGGSLDERLDRTRVLSSLLLMRRSGDAERSFLLDRSRAFSVGRDREKNTLSIADAAISSQHFKIVPRNGIFYFVDLDSTNGSFMSGRRIRAKRLRTGDVIRAGQTEFEFQNFGD